MIIGIDVSKYNVGWDPKKAVKPISFGIQRASWASYKDEKFDELYQGIKTLPVTGAYHYYSSGVPWKTQADLFLSVAQGKFDFYVVDYERAFNSLCNRTTAELTEMVKYIKEKTGQRCLAYFSKSIYDEFIYKYGYASWAKEQDIWYAWYPITLTQTPPVQVPWIPEGLNWKIWQYGGGDVNMTAGRHAGPDYGGGLAGMDLNYFNGTLPEMMEWAGVIPTSEIPPDTTPAPIPVPPVAIVERLATLKQSVLMRSGPSQTAGQVTALQPGVQVLVKKTIRDSAGNEWSQIADNVWFCTEYNHVPYVEWAAW